MVHGLAQHSGGRFAAGWTRCTLDATVLEFDDSIFA